MSCPPDEWSHCWVARVTHTPHTCTKHTHHTRTPHTHNTHPHRTCTHTAVKTLFNNSTPLTLSHTPPHSTQRFIAHYCNTPHHPLNTYARRQHHCTHLHTPPYLPFATTHLHTPQHTVSHHHTSSHTSTHLAQLDLSSNYDNIQMAHCYRTLPQQLSRARESAGIKMPWHTW